MVASPQSSPKKLKSDVKASNILVAESDSAMASSAGQPDSKAPSFGQDRTQHSSSSTADISRVAETQADAPLQSTAVDTAILDSATSRSKGRAKTGLILKKSKVSPIVEKDESAKGSLVAKPKSSTAPVPLAPRDDHTFETVSYEGADGGNEPQHKTRAAASRLRPKTSDVERTSKASEQPITASKAKTLSDEAALDQSADKGVPQPEARAQVKMLSPKKTGRSQAQHDDSTDEALHTESGNTRDLSTSRMAAKSGKTVPKTPDRLESQGLPAPTHNTTSRSKKTCGYFYHQVRQLTSQTAVKARSHESRLVYAKRMMVKKIREQTKRKRKTRWAVAMPQKKVRG